MDTLEDLYAGLFDKHEEKVCASNPYGCNQYGHEWRGKHGDDFGGGERKGGAALRQAEDRAKKATAEYDDFESAWDLDFGRRLRKTKYAKQFREDTAVAEAMKRRVLNKLDRAKNGGEREMQELDEAINSLDKMMKSLQRRKKLVNAETEE